MESERQLPFSTEFQLAILKLMLSDDGFALKCCKWLKKNYFENKHLSWVFTTIQKYWNDFHNPPSLSVIQNEARRHKIEDQAEYFNIIKNIIKKIRKQK